MGGAGHPPRGESQNFLLPEDVANINLLQSFDDSCDLRHAAAGHTFSQRLAEQEKKAGGRSGRESQVICSAALVHRAASDVFIVGSYVKQTINDCMVWDTTYGSTFKIMFSAVIIMDRLLTAIVYRNCYNTPLHR